MDGFCPVTDDRRNDKQQSAFCVARAGLFHGFPIESGMTVCLSGMIKLTGHYAKAKLSFAVLGILRKLARDGIT